MEDAQPETGTDSAPVAPTEQPQDHAGGWTNRFQQPSQYVELIVYLVAVLGALALGLGITSYLRDHPYIFAYLVAYAGFRFADLLVRPPYDARLDRDARWHRLGELPRL